jgi:hypothetical protein
VTKHLVLSFLGTRFSIPFLRGDNETSISGGLRFNIWPPRRLKDMVSRNSPSDVAQFLTSFFLEIGDRGIAGIVREYQMSAAKRAAILITVTPTVVVALVPVR